MSLPFRLLALDIDGTLLNSRFQVDPKDLAALRRAYQEGVSVMLCTGRRHTFALPIARELGFPVMIASSNGGVTRSLDGDTFYTDLLPAAKARSFCAYMHEFRSGTVITFDLPARGALVVEHTRELSQNFKRWVEHNEGWFEFVAPIEDCLVRDPVQAMVCGDLERMRVAEQHLSAWPDVGRVTVVKTRYDERNLCLIDILQADCNKGHAVERWAASQGWRREQVMAVGDNFNDQEMLDFAGHGVLMANAPEEMRRNGYHPTSSNDECGVSKAVNEAFGW